MILNVEFYEKLILETLYEGFMIRPPYRINNIDVESTFGKINDVTYFRIAREKLIQDGLNYGKKVNYYNPPYFQITGEGLVYYEMNYLNSDVIGDKKYDISNFIEKSDIVIKR